MKKYFWTLLFLMTIMQSAYPCSSFVLKNGKTILLGKNFDWTFDKGYIIKNLRNTTKVAYFTHNGTPASWTSKYGSITFNQNGKEMPYGGMNEKGLVVEMLWLEDTRFNISEDKTYLNELEWIQYQLDNFQTVDEVVANIESLKIYPIKGKIHYILADTYGKSVIIEYLDGQPINSLNSTNHYIMGNNNFYISNSNSSSVLNGVLNIDTINNIVTGTVEAYYYKFINEDPNNYYEQTLPSNPNIDIQYTIALHLRGDADLSVHEKDKLDNIIIYPNPSNTEITIKNLPNFVNNYDLRIYNTSGVLVDLKKINQTSEKINISHLSNGIYIFQLETDNYISTSKFIKQ